MTADPVTITEDTPLVEVVALMDHHRIHRLPVMRNSKVVWDRQPRRFAARLGAKPTQDHCDIETR